MSRQTYSTRHLTASQAGPPSESSSAPVRAAAPEPAAARIDDLRAEAERLGIAVNKSWSSVKLRNKIAKARETR
jgi:3-oxoacyl-ACP reductase-like protein